MNYSTYILLALQYGIPFASKAFDNWSKTGPITAEEVAELKDLAAQNSVTQAQAALTRAGIPLDDPRAKELLSLVQPATPEPSAPS